MFAAEEEQVEEINREELYETAIEAARRGGAVLQQKHGQHIEIKHKGEIDLVTEADTLSEEVIITLIEERYPYHYILSEEKGTRKRSSPYKWIIDPLDGTTNFAHGYPMFCVSVGLEYEGEVILGAVYDPIANEMFSTKKGGGAFLNGKRIHVSEVKDLSEALLTTGFPYDIRQDTVDNINYFSNFCRKAQAVRRPGSAALDLCYVASGRFDGFWEMKLFPWDVSAGALLVEEAGGKVTDFNGNTFDIYAREVLASNGLIHQDMIDVLAMSTA
jgi:myo-inositol-1(or 4)-monophosphatase